MSKMYFLPFRPAFDSAGITVPGSQHWFTLAGTNTPSAPFTDATLATPLENPVISNGVGYLSPVYLNPALSYRVRVYDADAEVGVDTPLEEYDPYVPALANADIFSDLADTTGAALIGLSGGGTVEDGVFNIGNQTPVAGVSAKVNRKREDATAPAALYGGLWSGLVTFDHAITKAFGAGASVANIPTATLLTVGKNTGSAGDVVSHMVVADAAATNASVFGSNIIAFSSGGASNVKLVGLEIDIQPQAASAPATASGLYINAFTLECPGNPIYVDGIFGGYFSTGIRIGRLNSATGAGIYGTSLMGSLVHSSTGTYGEDAIVLSNTHKLRLKGTGATHGKIYNHSDDRLRIVLGGASELVVRDNTDATSLFSVTPTGFGYPTGVGGTVTQATSKSTAVTLNKIVGQITLNNAALASGTNVSFTLNNSMIGANDFVYPMLPALMDKYKVRAGNTTTPGQCSLILENITGGSLSEAVIISFIVFKGAAS